MQIEENELERALQRTVKEPAHRPECYRILLQSTVFLQGPPGRTAKVYTTLAASDNIQIKSWRNDDGLSVIPFFSSPEALEGDDRTNERSSPAGRVGAAPMTLHRRVIQELV